MVQSQYRRCKDERASSKQTKQRTYTKDDIQIALSAIGQGVSARHAASSYDVPLSTLAARRAGIRPRHACEPNSKKLSELEEDAIVTLSQELDLQGIRATKTIVRNIVNNILARQERIPVGQN
jgi:hypothetical protein